MNRKILALETILFSIIFGFTTCCTGRILKDENLHKHNDTLKMWKDDSLGCKGFRTLSSAQFIINSIDFTGASLNDITLLLGKPNEMKSTGVFRKSIKYYFETQCDQGLIIDSVDFCWIDYTIAHGKVTNAGILCY